MKKTTRWLIYAAISGLFILSCRKVAIDESLKDGRTADASFSTSSPVSFQNIVDYLEAVRDTSPPILANKIQALLQNISESRIPVLEVTDSIGLYVCNLADYQNETPGGYRNSYYKLYFAIVNGNITGGLIYSVHTDISQSQLDSEFEDIFWQKSETFTGTAVYNDIDDTFLQELTFADGQIIKTSRLDIESDASEMCTEFYLVVTTYGTDEVTGETRTFLYTDCEGCTGPVGQSESLSIGSCAGGGGGSSPTDVDEVWIELEEVEGSINDDDRGVEPKPFTI